ncbi:hypothetical protein TREMEDRAFT_65771 [Tremella mesenterica DSM 1558]|uniref:uncharacterized protein n=1 Tax=Tremella mesenterica (strain ATCC 24925 / CBS 8224 / DSM 1558 / NBRC 9311 / NRRL Y-6157 / RJB 2259-6 / UBC 559-6) TaxID=578456 RepID=UPI00032BC1E1|nr:uncharacterized protein TREMEDRAFT_65771 [Tremella mesenterica DSM 1558]EIW66169.1 hypothetical protein TREMEDRAFT_65771 [Tremella mesenterica DSM 1558]
MIQRGEITPRSTLKKTRSGLEKVMAEKILLEQDMGYRKAAEALDREARSKKRERYPLGHLFSLQYREDHAAELNERRAVEVERREERKHTGGKKRGKGKDTCREVQPMENTQGESSSLSG